MNIFALISHVAGRAEICESSQGISAASDLQVVCKAGKGHWITGSDDTSEGGRK